MAHKRKKNDHKSEAHIHPLLNSIDVLLNEKMKKYSKNMIVKVEVYSTNPHILFFPSVKEFKGQNGWDKDRPKPGAFGIRFCQGDGINGWKWNELPKNAIQVVMKDGEKEIPYVTLAEDDELDEIVSQLDHLKKEGV